MVEAASSRRSLGTFQGEESEGGHRVGIHVRVFLPLVFVVATGLSGEGQDGVCAGSSGLLGAGVQLLGFLDTAGPVLPTQTKRIVCDVNTRNVFITTSM